MTVYAVPLYMNTALDRTVVGTVLAVPQNTKIKAIDKCHGLALAAL